MPFFFAFACKIRLNSGNEYIKIIKKRYIFTVFSAFFGGFSVCFSGVYIYARACVRKSLYVMLPLRWSTPSKVDFFRLGGVAFLNCAAVLHLHILFSIFVLQYSSTLFRNSVCFRSRSSATASTADICVRLKLSAETCL